MENGRISKNLLYSDKHFELLLELYRFSLANHTTIEIALDKITETVVEGLDIERCSFWKIENDRLVCLNLFEITTNSHTKADDLIATDLPIYFKALKDGIAIVADDVLNNTYTKELKENYLIPLGITDMLDLPIRIDGKLYGVLCCEHRDSDRVWIDSDLAFARSIADILSILFEQNNKKLVEKELVESERKLSLITNNSKDGFVVFENKVITYISPSYSEMLGYSEEEVYKMKLEDVFNSIHPEDVEKVRTIIYDNLAKREKNFKCEFRFKNKEGNYFWREDTASVLYDENGNYEKYIVISRDVTAIKTAEMEIDKMYTISKNLNERLLDFTYIISHNIRSNTSNISMIIDLIESTSDNDEKEEYFQLLKESNKKLVDTIYYLNETVNIQLSSKENRVKLNLKEEIEKILVAINAIVKSNNVTINYHIPDDFTIKVIPSYLESIMLNLITNAIKYRSKERDLIVEITAKKKENKYTISVKDNGLGIDLVKNKDKIFGMYKTFHGNPDAVGLGLFMTKNHIEALGGNIGVESKINIGSEFKFRLYE